MSIVIIQGEEKSGKTLIANALRSSQINNRNGALLIDEDQDGEINFLLEKIIKGQKFNAEEWKNLEWKDDSMIILVGKKSAMLNEFEDMMPGFTEFFGPVYTVDTGKKQEE